MSGTKNNLIDTLNDVKVETINFNGLTEHQKQVKKRADVFCRHLKGIKTIDKLIPELDQSISITCCSQCGQELSDKDLEKRERIINKFKR